MKIIIRTERMSPIIPAANIIIAIGTGLTVQARTPIKVTHSDITKQINESLEEYKTNCQHIRAAKFSNKLLNTNFTKSDSPKMLFINHSDSDVMMIDEGLQIPQNISIN